MKTNFDLMKKLLSLLFLILTFEFAANATTYYFAANGNDANNGTSTSTPWKTIAKFNSVFASKSAGDNFLFNRGDVFYGRLNITRSGASGSPITIGAYGTGAMPVISGFTTVSSWTNLGNNIWESTSSVSALSYVNMVTINGINTPMGRYPNTGYLTYQSYTGNTSITSSSLSGSPNWTGAELVDFATRASFSRAPIIAQSGGTLTFTPSPKIAVWDHNVPQFFIQNDPRTLDVINEWYFNPSTKKIRIYNTTTPTDVKLATVDTLVYMNGRNYITFNNMSFQGSNIVSIGVNSSQHISILSCDFNFSGRDAIDGPWTNSSTGLDIESNTFNHSNNNAIYLSQICDHATIRSNTITNTGVIPGMTNISDQNCSAINAPGAYTLIEYNTIDSVGYSAIKFFGSYTNVNNNYLRNFCLILRDGGGIYTWNVGKSIQAGINILNNIVINNNTSSGLNTENYGIYLDDLSNNIVISGNTSANCGWGIELHSVTNVTVKNNTTYNNSMASIFLMSDNNAGGVSGLTIMDNIQLKNNIFFAKTSKQKTLWLYPLILPIVPPDFHTDSNYYARPIDNNGYSILSNYQPKGGTQVLTTMNLLSWQTFCFQEVHSKVDPKAITDTNDLRLEYNATSSSKTISLPYNYIDVRGVNYNGSITLAPFTSAVLTKNGAATNQGNQAPTANAGPDHTIILPTSIVSIYGSGTDPDGTISAYNWTQISGPSSGIITYPTSAATTVTALVAGIYKFQLKVTDNLGATGLDTVQVTVNTATTTLLPAVNPANTVNGLNYNYYASGSGWSVVPDFNTMTPTSRGVTTAFNISPATQLLTFAFKFAGYINVPSDGTYTFYTTSDDGSNLYIDGVLVVNNDGMHGAIEKLGAIGLKAGKHAITVGYFQQGGGSVLSVSYAGPGISKQVVPASALYIVTGSLALDNNINQVITSSTQVSIKAYPNPFANYIEISIAGGIAGEYKLMLVDAIGRIVWTKSGIKNEGAFQQTINTSTLERGAYFVKVIQNNTTSVIELVK
jgi:parallel beta-helix repeat protein